MEGQHCGRCTRQPGAVEQLVGLLRLRHEREDGGVERCRVNPQAAVQQARHLRSAEDATNHRRGRVSARRRRT